MSVIFQRLGRGCSVDAIIVGVCDWGFPDNGEPICDAFELRNRSRSSQEISALDVRKRSRIIVFDGEEAKKPVCCSARSQGREERRSRQSC